MLAIHTDLFLLVGKLTHRTNALAPWVYKLD